MVEIEKPANIAATTGLDFAITFKETLIEIKLASGQLARRFLAGTVCYNFY